MKILAVESSAQSASVALTEDGKLLCEIYSNIAMTHSQTLAPMCENVFNACGVSPKDIDVFAVAAGPGSFTGVRIGISFVKGMALAAEKPCTAVSSLEALAHNVITFEGIICASMDARCKQVYNAVFKTEGQKLTRITPDRAISISELVNEISQLKKKTIFVGDGAQLCYNEAEKENVSIAPENLRYQRASSVAFAAESTATTDAKYLDAFYVRLPQAERERLARGK